MLAAKAQGLVELTPGSNKFVVPEAKKAMDYMLEMQSNARFAKANAKLLTDAMGLWKLTQTAIRPGSHITNGIGDITTALIGGVSSPRPFLQSYSIMRHDGKSIIKSFIDGKMDAAEIEHSFITQGANTGQQLVENREIINSLGGKASSIPFKVVNSKPAHVIRKIAEGREEFPRLATYIDELDKAAARGLTKEQAIKSATIRTLKYHFDYSDLTPFEKSLRRTVVPFYTFMRKNTPLMLQSILTKPGRIAAIPKTFNGMEKFLGTDQPGALDTIKGPFQGLYDLTKSNPQGDNYTFDPKLGATDALKVVDDPLGQLLGSLGPVTKEIQQMGGKTPAGLPAGSFKDQLMNETWITRMINDATTGKKSGSEQALAAVKNITGLGIQKNKGKSKLYDLKKENSKIAKELKAKLLEGK